MIIKASQRSGARNLANHLTNSLENDHVELHQIRGLAGTSVHAALLEIDAVSQGTRASQPLFSVSFNPPIGEQVTNAQFEQAFDKLEQKLGLADQPRVAIFHEKEGRRHCHVVWSRIDVTEMKAINLSHFKNKCTEVSRELYQEHGWQMPKGLQDREKRDPYKITYNEWQQAKRHGVDPKEIKSLIQDAWNRSDNLNSFKHALEERGLFIAKGDKRGFVVLDHDEKVFSLSRHGGIKTKELKAKLGNPEELSSINVTKQRIRLAYNAEMREMIKKLKDKHREQIKPLNDKKALLVHIQKAERQELKDRQRIKRKIVTKNGRDKFRRGIMGIFDKLTGKERRLRLINQKEINRTKNQQTESKQKLIFRHNMERAELQKQIEQVKKRQQEERKQLSMRIHQMRTLKHEREQARNGLSRDFNHATLDREKQENTREQTRTHKDNSEQKNTRARHRKLNR